VQAEVLKDRLLRDNVTQTVSDGKSCLPRLQAASSDADAGYDDEYRGFYDVQGCGKCLDYCRWVGASGSGGDPALQTEKGESYWSCSVAGSKDPYTAKGHFGATFSQKKCVGAGVAQICSLGLRTAIGDGYEDNYKGWYDLQGCGQCLDFCRWVGASGSGGDPAMQTEHGESYWSCSLVGSGDPYTPKGHFGTSFSHKRCTGGTAADTQGVVKPCPSGLQRSSISYSDAGWQDGYRGLYDVQGCGQCLDYCRWVGMSGSGGDPAEQTESGQSFWSCSLAGSGDQYTQKGFFGTTFSYKKCDGGDPGGVKKTCAPDLRAATSDVDPGFADDYRGWYDAQGCGQCLDYCRWVGRTGSGGDPAVKAETAGSYWSCNLAGRHDPYTARGYFGPRFLPKKCSGSPAVAKQGAARDFEPRANLHMPEPSEGSSRDGA